MSNLRSSGRSAVATPERTEDGTADAPSTVAPRSRLGGDFDLMDAPSPGEGDVAQPGRGDADEEVGHDLPVSVPGETQSPAKASDIEPVPGYRPIAQLRSASEQATLARATRQPLDAWYATYADPATIERMAYRQQELTRSVIEVVIGVDDRVRINPTTAYAWRCVCSLGITAANGSTWIGTGWLVAPRTVITAGHCVWMHNQGGRVASIRVMPGRNGSATETPFKSCLATHVRTTVKWIDDKDSDRDYGCILLPQSFLDYSSLGTFGYASLSDLDDMTVNLSGYPGDKPTGTQWFHSRKIKNVESRRFYYDIDTAGGQSGAPVWRFKDNERHVVGIHTNGASTGNSAVRITSAVFDNIKTWKHWYD
jgi:glutamyl endopeptidase